MGQKEDWADMVKKMMQDPAITGLLQELRRQNNAEDGKSGDPLARLPEMLEVLSPFLQEQHGTSASEAEETARQPPDASEPADSREVIPKADIFPVKKADKQRAETLLYALKPYLRPSRGEIIDQCVSVLQLADVVGGLQGMENLFRKDGQKKGGA